MSPPPRDDYDDVPYTSRAYAESHPDRLRVVARLSGWNPPGLAGARLLEIGSGRGGNLLAMASSTPSARFVGVERSERQATEARSIGERLGVTNMTIHASTFERVDLPPATFDFVVAHGVYSWVPELGRRRLLERIAAWLSPAGVAYVSLNVLPGWYEKLAARDWLRFGGSAAGRSPAESLRWLRDQASPELGAYRDALARVEARLRETSPAYAAHEYFEAENHPALIGDALREAHDAGLTYLGDAIPSEVAFETLPDAARRAADAASATEAQQLVDFVRCTSFRRMLLVRADTAAACGWRFTGRLDPGVVRTLRIASRLRPSADGTLFSGPAGSIRVDGWAAAVLRQLATVAPRALAFDDLAEGGRAGLEAELLDLWLGVDGLDLHDHEPAFTTDVTERPEASAVARHAVARSEPVTNLWHQEVALPDSVVRALLERADGSLGVAELARVVGVPEPLARAALELLARSALLVA